MTKKGGRVSKSVLTVKYMFTCDTILILTRRSFFSLFFSSRDSIKRSIEMDLEEIEDEMEDESLGSHDSEDRSEQDEDDDEDELNDNDFIADSDDCMSVDEEEEDVNQGQDTEQDDGDDSEEDDSDEEESCDEEDDLDINNESIGSDTSRSHVTYGQVGEADRKPDLNKVIRQKLRGNLTEVELKKYNKPLAKFDVYDPIEYSNLKRLLNNPQMGTTMTLWNFSEEAKNSQVACAPGFSLPDDEDDNISTGEEEQKKQRRSPKKTKTNHGDCKPKKATKKDENDDDGKFTTYRVSYLYRIHI